MRAQHRSIVGFMLIPCLCALLSGCYIPDEYNVEITANSGDEVSWAYDGKWQFVHPKFDPRRVPLPEDDVEVFTKELSNMHGSTSLSHVENHVWKQSLAWHAPLFDAEKKRKVINFPSLDYWMFRITPESQNSFILETKPAPGKADLEKLKAMGYRSSGTFTLKTSGIIEQSSGQPLVKSWFRSVYSVKINGFDDEPIKLRVKFSK
jgi:hypothetical protein